MLRATGNLERYSTARHSLGHYRCVANTARYTVDDFPADLPAAIEVAVGQTALRHPTLCCGIINEDQNHSAFVRLESIDLSKSIEYREVVASTIADYDQGLLAILEDQHSQLWPDLHCRPAWKVIVVESKFLSSGKEVVFDAVFAFHHAIADGLSGVVFHRSMLDALNRPSERTAVSDHLIMVPESLSLPPPVEDLIDFKLSWRYLFQEAWRDLRPEWLFPESSPPWTAAPCSSCDSQKYKTRIRMISIPPGLVSKIIAACRAQKATVTGLLHGLIVVSLTKHVPSATSFNSSTPYSLRHLTGLSPTDEIGLQISGLASTYSCDTISSIRASASDSTLQMEEIWAIARMFRSSMSAELSRLPDDNVIGLLSYVPNFQSMFTSKIGKPRGDTFEVSNVGSYTSNAADERWKIERLLFSQSGMCTGPAISFNLVSVAGGPLTISIVWLEGVVEEALAGKVVEDVDDYLRNIGEGNGTSLAI